MKPQKTFTIISFVGYLIELKVNSWNKIQKQKRVENKEIIVRRQN
jgi:hypothetical protein